MDTHLVTIYYHGADKAPQTSHQPNMEHTYCPLSDSHNGEI